MIIFILFVFVVGLSNFTGDSYSSREGTGDVSGEIVGMTESGLVSVVPTSKFIRLGIGSTQRTSGGVRKWWFY